MRASFSRSPSIKTLIDEWSRLYALSDAHFFLSPAWIETWLENLPAGADIGCVRVFDDLRGVYGLALVGTTQRRPFKALEARLHETGDESFDRIYTEYNDILLARDAPQGARETAIDAIIDALPKVEEFVFRNARPALAAALDAVARRRKFLSRRLLSQPSYKIDLQSPGGRDAVFSTFSPSLRAKIRRSMRRYAERGELRLIRTRTDAERAVAWTGLMRLHAETWSRRGIAGVFSEPSFTKFHHSLTEARPASVDLVRLTIGGDTIGVLYNFIASDRVYNYQSGFRYETDNQLVPGFVAHALAAEQYREAGFHVYDLMGGDAEYKRRLGKPGESSVSIALNRPGLHGAARAVSDAITRLGAEGKRQT